VPVHVTEAACLNFVFTQFARSVKKVQVSRTGAYRRRSTDGMIRMIHRIIRMILHLTARLAGTCSLLLVRAVTLGLNCLRTDKRITA